MRVRLLPVAGLVLASILACSNPSTTTEKDVTTPPAPTPPTTTTPMTVPPAPTSPPPATSDVAIGVIQCDEYIIKMTECLGKMDGTAKETLNASFTQTREAWKAAAATPEGKTALATTCATALQSLASMTCAPTKVEEPKEEVKEKETKDEDRTHRRSDGPVRPPPGQGKGRNR